MSQATRAPKARAFAKNYEVLGPPISIWDERWPAAAVERAMIAADISRVKRAADSFILQGAMDAMVV